MIVLIGERNDLSYSLTKGDVFNLSVEGNADGFGKRLTILSEEITKDTVVDYFAIFVFTLESGEMIGVNMCGIFGQQKNMPTEIKTAKRLHDLTEKQKKNLTRTAPFDIKTALKN